MPPRWVQPVLFVGRGRLVANLGGQPVPQPGTVNPGEGSLILHLHTRSQEPHILCPNPTVDAAVVALCWGVVASVLLVLSEYLRQGAAHALVSKRLIAA